MNNMNAFIVKQKFPILIMGFANDSAQLLASIFIHAPGNIDFIFVVGGITINMNETTQGKA